MVQIFGTKTQFKVRENSLQFQIELFMHELELMMLKLTNLIPYRLPQGQLEIQQRKLLYMGLYLLIWGEAANVRFMPECLCYIFHNVSTVLMCVYFLLVISLIWIQNLFVVSSVNYYYVFDNDVNFTFRWHTNSMAYWLEMSALLLVKTLSLLTVGMMRLSCERL